MTWAKPPVVCEKEDAHRWPNGMWDDAADEDCAFCSVLMQYLAAHPGAAPATLTEAEAIRAAAGLGPAGGATSDDTIRGTMKRYGWAPTKIPAGFDVLWSALRPGISAAVSGKPSSCSTGNPFKRYLPTYTGGHKVFIEKLDDTDRIWLEDPEGPRTGYSGEWATKAHLMEFVNGGSSHTIAPIAAQEEDMLSIATYLPGQVATVKAGHNVRKAPSLTAAVIRVTAAIETWTVIGFVKGDTDPADGSDLWLVRWNGQYEYTSHANLATQPAPTGVTQAQLEAAVLAARRKQYDDDLAAANADPVAIGPRP